MRTLLIVAAGAGLLIAGAAVAQAVLPAKPTTIEGLTATVVSLQQQINVQKNQIADLQAKQKLVVGYPTHTHNMQRTVATVATVTCTGPGACKADGNSAQVLTSFTVGTAK